MVGFPAIFFLFKRANPLSLHKNSHTMDALSQLLQNGYFALFLILTVGYLVGKISVKGISLDVSAVIFVALVFGHFGVTLPKIIQDIGLVLFIFTIGIQAGPGFFEALKNHGIKLASLSAILVFTAGIIGIGAHYIWDLDMGVVAGLLAGALTSTPGLASATDQFGDIPSIGYGIAYPFGVIGVILFLRILPKLMRTNIPEAEAEYDRSITVDHPLVLAQNVVITNPNVDQRSLQSLRVRSMTEAVVSRVMHGDEAITPSAGTVLQLGDLARVVGTEEAIQRATLLLGTPTDREMPLSKNYDVERVLVTNKDVVNKTVAELNLQANYDATITRIRRSGIDIAPSPRIRIRLGDKLVVACNKENMKQVHKLFGNDDKVLSDTDILPIAFGIVLGVLLGAFTPLGLTGGVLTVALILSKIGKTGPILWTMSSSANVLLREIGLIFFLAVVGTNAGATLIDTYNLYGYKLFLIGGLLTLIPMIVALLVAKLLFKTNALTLLGALAGGMTSTPGLAAITPMTKKNAPQIAYATTYPIAMVLVVIVMKVFGLF
jgi:putative transport protein